MPGCHRKIAIRAGISHKGIRGMDQDARPHRAWAVRGGQSVNDRWRNLWRRVARWFGRRAPPPDAADVDADLLDIDLRRNPATSPDDTLPPYVDVPLDVEATASRTS